MSLPTRKFRLTLHCNCGDSKLFSGADVDAVIDAIDAAGWRELDRGGGKGWKPGKCATCISTSNQEA